MRIKRKKNFHVTGSTLFRCGRKRPFGTHRGTCHKLSYFFEFRPDFFTPGTQCSTETESVKKFTYLPPYPLPGSSLHTCTVFTSILELYSMCLNLSLAVAFNSVKTPIRDAGRGIIVTVVVGRWCGIQERTSPLTLIC